MPIYEFQNFIFLAKIETISAQNRSLMMSSPNITFYRTSFCVTKKISILTMSATHLIVGFNHLDSTDSISGSIRLTQALPSFKASIPLSNSNKPILDSLGVSNTSGGSPAIRLRVIRS